MPNCIIENCKSESVFDSQKCWDHVEDKPGYREKVVALIKNGSSLKGANLSKVDLSNLDLAKTDFSGANLSRANLANANFFDSILKNTELRIIIECTTLNIFKFMSDKLFMTSVASIDNPITNFELNKDHIEKINSLANLDDEYKFMEFIKSANIYISGKTFNFKLVDINDEWDGSEKTINIFKNQFEKLDNEIYNVEMGDDRLIFNSKSSDTTCVISMVEKD